MSNTLSTSVEQSLRDILSSHPLVAKIVNDIAQAGGQSLLVGGAVRDLLLGIAVKDLDIEVHRLSLQQLEQILRHHGPVSLVGKSFGVLRLHTLDIDWSLPRADSVGRKPEVVINPHMQIKDAFGRRDLTINAMGIDLITCKLFDPFNGMDDLHEGLLRAPDTALFIEDPLRFYRVMQFVGRFEMTPDVALNQVCATMDISHISRERIEVEFEKLLLKSKRPSLGIRWLRTIGRLQEVLPEVATLVDVAQNPRWHPEGDVFEHTMQAVDAAATLTTYDNENKLILLYAALCHDLGKPATTKYIGGVLKSLGHEEVGVDIAKKLLHRITHNTALVDAVCKLVRYHMMPVQLVHGGAKPPAYKRLARQLAPDISMQMLADLSLADKSGRNPTSSVPLHEPIPEIDTFLQHAELATVRFQSEAPILYGRHIADVIEGGPVMGNALRNAYEIQIEEGIRDKDILRQRVLADLKKRRS